MKICKKVYVEEELPEEVATALKLIADTVSHTSEEFSLYRYHEQLEMIYRELFSIPDNVEDFYIEP